MTIGYRAPQPVLGISAVPVAAVGFGAPLPILGIALQIPVATVGFRSPLPLPLIYSNPAEVTPVVSPGYRGVDLQRLRLEDDELALLMFVVAKSRGKRN